MKNQRDKRNYIIIALCAILVIMGVGYASFSTLLTINGTANITNSFCLGFDNTKTNTMSITKGIQTGATPAGTMSYSGTACNTNLTTKCQFICNIPSARRSNRIYSYYNKWKSIV